MRQSTSLPTLLLFLLLLCLLWPGVADGQLFFSPSRRIQVKDTNPATCSSSPMEWWWKTGSGSGLVACTTTDTPTLIVPSDGVSGTGAIPLSSLWTWTTPAFNAANFTSAGTWTVDEADVATYAYIEIGKSMTVAWRILTTDLSGAPTSALRIKIPNDRTAAKTMHNSYVYNDAAAGLTSGLIVVSAAGTTIDLYKLPSGTWTNTAADNTSVYGQITLEIQ